MKKRVYGLIILIILVLGSISQKSYASSAPLSYWYSDANMVGYWDGSPAVWTATVGEESTFMTFTYMLYARNLWSNAGKPTTYSGSYSNANIACYGGTRTDILNTTGVWVSTTDVAVTIGASSHMYYRSYQNSLKDIKKQITYQKIYIVDEGNYNFYNTATHELGHALGWLGHSTDTGIAVMRSDVAIYNSNISLSFSDKIQLNQIY